MKELVFRNGYIIPQNSTFVKKYIFEHKNIKNKFLLVEQEGGWHDIVTHNYRNDYNEKSYYNTMCTLMANYDLKICFLPKEEMGLMIWTICKSVLNQYVLHESV